MRQTAVLVVLCLASAVLGALATRVIDPDEGDSPRTASSTELAEAVRDLARVVDTLEKNLEPLRHAPSLTGPARPPPSPAEATPIPASHEEAEAGVERGADPAAMTGSDLLVQRSASDPPLPPAVRERLEEVGRWSEDEELRGRWLLASEASVLAWFGAPDAIYAEASGERWTYERLIQGTRKHLMIYIHRGRVIRMYP